jgi:polysaccharide biosynthesis protein PslE
MIRNENYLRSFLIILFAHKRLIIVLAVAFALLTLLTAFLFPPIYSIEGALLVKSKTISPPLENTEEGVYQTKVLPPTREDVISEIEIIASRDLIQLAIGKLKESGAPITPEPSLLGRLLKNSVMPFLRRYVISPLKENVVEPLMAQFGFEMAGGPPSLTEVEERAREIKEIMEAVVLPGSNVIQVRYLYGDADIGAAILNAIFDNYLHYRFSLFTNPSQEHFFSEQIQRIEAAMSRLREEKVAILRNIKSSDIGKDLDVQMSLAEKLRRDIQTLEQERLEKRETVRDLDRLFDTYNVGSEPQFIPFPYDFQDTEIDRYGARLGELVFDYNETLRTFHKNTEKIRILEDEICGLKSVYVRMIRNLIEQKRNALKIINDVMADKKKNMAALQARNQRLKETDILLRPLDAELETLAANHRTFFRKAEASKISQAYEITQLSNVQIISHAAAPDKPFFPKKKVMIPVGFFVSLLLALSLGFMWEFFDHTFKTPDQVEEHLKAPLIGSILYRKRKFFRK